MGRITVATRNPADAAIFINGRPTNANPVTNYEVPAGTVTIVFRWTDAATGSRERSMTVTVAAGQTLNLRRIDLSANP